MGVPASWIWLQCPHHIAVSIDDRGMMQYWRPGDGEVPHAVSFPNMIDTDLFDLARVRVLPLCLAVAPDGESFAVLAADESVRVFRLRSGRLRRKSEPQRKLNREELDPSDAKYQARCAAAMDERPRDHHVSMTYDQSGKYLVFPTETGVKVYHVDSRTVVSTLGELEWSERLLSVSLYQGIPKISSKRRAK